VTNDFDKNGYVHLHKIISKEKCNDLIEELNQLIKDKKTKSDIMCPNSQSIYGYFDFLLEELQPQFEKASGKSLIPTYTYTRMYAAGEDLKIHSDRPSCEISASLTLGWSGKEWSIFMADPDENGEYITTVNYENDSYKVSNIKEIVLDSGDVVLYKGQEKTHWRNKFEGEWQAQVFLHYVDANGPNTEYKYDKREKLGLLQPQSLEKVSTRITSCAIFDNHLSESFCDNIISRYQQDDIEKIEPTVGSGEGIIDRNTRDVKRVLLPETVGIGGTLTATALNANHYWWKYNVTHANQTELLIYNKTHHYTGHVDTIHEHSDITRKLTCLAILNNEFEGGKFWINANGNKFYPPQNKGTVLVFPSYMIHGVEPVTKGVRYSCVTWLVGPYFK
jgi:hypothetical protein